MDERAAAGIGMSSIPFRAENYRHGGDLSQIGDTTTATGRRDVAGGPAPLNHCRS